jgi:hypothetical protein
MHETQNHNDAACLRKEFCRDVSTALDMTQTRKAKRPGSFFEPGRCELTNVTALESLLQPDVPEPALNRGN